MYTKGLALFALGPNFWNKPSISPAEVTTRMERVWPVGIFSQFAIVDAISNDQRGGRVPTRDEIRTWIETDMPAFFQNLHQMNHPEAREIKKVLKENFGINVDKTGTEDDVRRYFADKSKRLWKTFFANGQSNTGEFVRTLTSDVLWRDGEAYDRRIAVARPLFGLFGGEETAILIEHAAIAYDHVYDHDRQNFIPWVQRAVNIPFSSETEKHAYELCAQKVITDPNEPHWRMRRRGEEAAPNPARKGPEPTVATQEPPSSPQPPSVAPAPEPSPAPAPPPAEEPHRRTGAPPAPLPTALRGHEGGPQPKVEQKTQQPYTVGEEIAASPDHDNYSADRALARPIAKGESVLVSAMDGMGSGGEYSVEPARIMKRQLEEEVKALDHVPTVREGVLALARAYIYGARKIDTYRKNLKEQGIEESILKNVGTVGVASIVCRENGEDILVALHLGDSRLYLYSPDNQKLQQITRDHTPPQLLAAAGNISPDDVFLHPRRNEVYRSVNTSSVEDMLLDIIEGKRADDYFVVPLPATPHVIFAVTDGWTDNTPPKREKERVKNAYEQAMQGGKFNPKVFTHQLIEGAREVMKMSSGTVVEGYTVDDFAKRDDVGVAVAYRLGRT